tara:strand:+ start:42 stop:347 length:306 start_codon:yes stop_codon:yes gene_type:complete
MLLKLIFVILMIMFLSLQVELWFGDGSLAHKTELENLLTKQSEENKRLKEKNEDLIKKISSLKDSSSSIEEIAREDLGMVRNNEVFYLVTEDEGEQNDDSP